MTDLLIDGQVRPGKAGRTYRNINPANEAPIGDACDGTYEDLDAALAAARRAFDHSSWATDRELRAHCLGQFLDGLRAQQERLRAILVDEAGVPVALTHSIWLDTIVDSVSYWADLALSYPYQVDVVARDTLAAVRSRRTVLHEPVGVVAAITPWNYPLALNLFKVSAAMASGCTIVLKPAPDTPWSATALGAIIAEYTDVPAGVVNVVSSADPTLGAAMVSDTRVDMITFTGSTVTGKKVMSAAADSLKRVCLELGGKSAYIVLDDSDFVGLAEAATGVCAHAGQGCASTTRLLLPRSRYSEGVDIVAAAYESLQCGDPNDPSVIVGPLINSTQRQRVLQLIEVGKSEAKLLVGGGTPKSMTTGYYVEPTLFADVEPFSRIAQEEIFGPVLSIIPFDDDDDAVRIANASSYGLSGAVVGADEDRAMAVARRIRTGTVSVNGGMWFATDTPFGGYKQSGLGREFGTAGLSEFLETKSIALPDKEN